MELRRPHPLYAVVSLSRYLYLLLLPLARGFISAWGGGVAAWLEGAWFDLCILGLLFGLGGLLWLCTQYRADKEGIFLTTGIFRRREVLLPAGKITCLSAVQPFYLRPFRAVFLRADTPAGSYKRADFSLLLPQREADRILALAKGEGPQSVKQYEPRGVAIVALSLATSNSFAGILLLSTLISQTGQLLGEEFADRVYGAFAQVSRLMAFGIPPAAAFLAYLILAGWALAFLGNLIKYYRFVIGRRESSLAIQGGLFTRREYALSLSGVSYLDIRQTVFTSVLHLHTVFIHAIGYGKHKGDVSILMPACTSRTLRQGLRLLLPELAPSPRQLKPNLGALFRFLIAPFWPCFLFPAGTVLLCWLFPTWREILGFLGFMASVPAYWFLTVRVLDFCSTGVSKEGNFYTLRYSSGYYLHTVVIPREKIASVTVEQNPFQWRDDRCDLIIATYGEGRKWHRVKNLDRRELLPFFQLEDPTRKM